MPKTYEPIASTTLSAGTATIDFTSIPQTYTDLVLVIWPILSGSGATAYMRFNSDAGSNYSHTALTGNGTSASSSRGSNLTDGIGIGGLSTGYGTTNNVILTHIMNYSNTTTNKTVISRWSNAGTGVDLVAGLWRSTAAITSFTIRNNGGHTYSSGSTFVLYGIKAA